MKRGKTPLVFLLAGGKGSRLSSVENRLPKVLLPFAGEAFLSHLLRRLASHGISEVVLLLGHRSEQVLEFLSSFQISGMKIRTQIESEARGSAGALADGLKTLEHKEPVVVLNADTWWEDSLEVFFARGLKETEEACVGLTKSTGEARYGLVSATETKAQFLSDAKAPFVYAGIAWIAPRILADICPTGLISLEQDIFPRLSAIAPVFLASSFFDFGTPEALQKFKALSNQGLR